jgi:hypothetical protein
VRRPARQPSADAADTSQLHLYSIEAGPVRLSPSFDLHAAESAAQVAAIWFVLKAMTRVQFEGLTVAERAAYLDKLLMTAETITLPSTDDPDSKSAAQWIAHRYGQLIAEFVQQMSIQ